jgi:uncharacterized membrane protein YdbT with pleckstrin-like domain
LSTEKQEQHSNHEDVVWKGKPYITPAVAIRTVVLFFFSVLFVLLEFYANVAQTKLWIFPVYIWSILIFIVFYAISLFGLLILWASNTYILRQEAIEVHNGMLSLHSFVVTPQGFGDLMVNQSINGRIFSYGNIIINSQGERQTKLRLVHSPFEVADKIRKIMGKPVVRVENHA